MGLALALSVVPASLLADSPVVSIAPAQSDVRFNPLGEGIGFEFDLVKPPAFSIETMGDPGDVQLDHVLLGARTVFSGVWAVAGFGDDPIFLEWNTGFGVAQNSSSTSTELSALSSSTLTMGTAPTGTINITSSTAGGTSTATVDATVTDGTGDSATINSTASSTTGQVSQNAISATAEGGVFVAITTDGAASEAAGYGAIYDADGFRFVSSGDTAGSVLETTIADQSFRLDQEFLLSTQVSSGSDFRISLKAGPTFSFTNRSVTRSEVVNIAETVDTALPTIGLTTSDSVSTLSLGVMAGGGISTELSPDWLIGLDAALGISAYRASYSYSSQVTGLNVGHVPATTASQSMTGVSALGRLQLSVTHYLNDASALSFSLFGEERLGVPTISRTGGVAQLTTGNSWTAGVGVSYSMRF
ncbi:MAG: hypothetical protein P8X77_07060 [Maritimibacter sp.]